MAPASSEEEEQGNEEADSMVAPAAPERQEAAASTVDERNKKLIEEALSSVGSGSEVLEAARRGRVTGDLELRRLDFLEKELSIIIAGLTALCPQHVDWEMDRWLRDLTGWASGSLLTTALSNADPRRHNTLLRRAARFFRRRHRSRHTFEFLLYAAEIFYILAEDPCRYRHLLPATSRHGLPPQAAEEGDASGLIPVDMDWFGRSPAPFDDSPYGKTPLIMSCMSMSPYGYKFEKDRLAMRWLFEGIFSFRVFFVYISKLKAKEAEQEEAKAGEYFSYLVDRNVITQAAPNSRQRPNLLDEAVAWQLNVDHTQHQILATRSAEIGFAFTSATLNLLAEASATGHGNEACRIPRRLALHHDDPNISLLQKIDLSQTRSLAVSGAVSIGVPLDKFVNLVVLDVEGWEKFGDVDLLRVCRSKMFFLRYLSIRNTRISKLPPEIDMLPSLEVLDASKTEVTEILFGVSEEIVLYRLDLRGTPMRQLTLPKKFRRLYHLLLGGEGTSNSTETAIRLPHDIRRFRMLRTLATVDLGEQPASFVEALGDLLSLKVLAITWSFHQSSDIDYCEALLSSIKRWEDLKSLTIHCGLGCSMEFLGSLSHPPRGLDKFKVTLGRFIGVPQWFRGLVVSFVQITVCKLEAQDLKILRNLLYLKCLILGLDFIPKQAIVIGNEGFSCLERFSIDCPVPWLTFESEAMPKLTYIQLEFGACSMDQNSVPSGITNLSSLKEVALRYNVRYANSSCVKIVEAVRQEVAKRSNRTQKISLFINGTKQDDVQAVDEETENTTGAPSGPDAGAQGDVEAVDEKTTTVFDTEITEAES